MKTFQELADRATEGKGESAMYTSIEYTEISHPDASSEV